MGLSPHASFEFRLSEWLPGANGDGFGTVAEIRRAGTAAMLCVSGEGERDSACPEARGPSVRAVTIGTGHHFGGRTDEIVSQLLTTAATADSH
jgi:type IV secretory pathway VirJ component